MERRNRNISLSSETIGNILRLFPRKQLSQKFYLVNRNIYQVATSQYFVPNLHLIKELFIDTRIIGRKVRYICDDAERYVSDFNPETNCCFGDLIRIESVANPEYYRFPVSYFVKKMPTPEAFVRFSDVTIIDCQDEAFIKFLRNANESFIGCRLSLGQYNHSLSNDTQNKLAFLLSNAFLRPKKIYMNLNCASGLQQIMQTEAVSNCDNLHIAHGQLAYSQELHSALLSWIQNDGREKSKPVQGYGRVLVLGGYLRRMVMDMVEHLKQAFQDDNSPPAAFLITFPGSVAGLEEGDHSFSLDKVSTGEKLSFFAKNRTGDVCLWRRRVTSKAVEWMMEYQYNRKTDPRND
ncbi:hypothetical protein DdX_16998 [Ditylenchus destructor]|uniref:F-box domain-containing protein n=1 Tax=Ditylenchus destructor TaxID=166010 RepID=A0AAD4MMG6_9BILA|nr:hypothetical protein DdX_16998 [Ditylenchus destructor]